MDATKSRGGRPPVADELRRSHVVTIRMSRAELDALQIVSGGNPRAWIRAQVLAAQRTIERRRRAGTLDKRDP